MKRRLDRRSVASPIDRETRVSWSLWDGPTRKAGAAHRIKCYNQHDQTGVSCSRAPDVSSSRPGTVGEWLSLVEHLVRDTTEPRDLESKPLIRRCFSTEIPMETY